MCPPPFDPSPDLCLSRSADNLRFQTRTTLIGSPNLSGGKTMLWLIFFVLLIAWILGLVGTYTIGSWLWLLLVAAVVVLIIQLATGRRPVA